METAQKSFLTIQELAVMLGKAYGTVREWILADRIKAETREVSGRKFYRVTIEEAERVKSRLESGIWA